MNSSFSGKVICAATALGMSASAWAAGYTAGEDPFTYRLTLFLHQVLFVFWLGPDIGVYTWRTKVTNAELSPAQRVSAGRMMQAIAGVHFNYSYPLEFWELLQSINGDKG